MEGKEERTQLEFYALRILPQCQVSKFRYRQDLLAKELENEAENPEVNNVLSDIFVAVREKNIKKFLTARKHLNGRVDEETIRQSIRRSIAAKTEPITKRESEVLHALHAGKSLLEVF